MRTVRLEGRGSVKFGGLRTIIAALALVAAACSSNASESTAGGNGSDPISSTAEVPATTSAPVTTTTIATTTTSTSAAPTTTSTAPPVVGDISWAPCGSGECGTLAVPLDHDDPGGETIDIAVSRFASTPPDRVGSLFINFGGPSGETNEILAFSGPFYSTLFDGRFDIIGWDPRATGETAPLQCESFRDDDIGVGFIDPGDGFTAELAEEEASFLELAACAEASGPIVDHLSTSDVARDLDLLRQAVGDDGLSYLGYSYGTQIGWVYASLFPQNVRAMILDGAVPPGSFGSAGLVEQYEGFERTFAEFDAVCNANAARCEQASEGLATTVDRLTAELRANPIQSNDGSIYTAEDFLEGVLITLYTEAGSSVPGLSRNITSVDAGNPGPFIADAQSGNSSSTAGVYKAVNCADGFDVDSPEDSIAHLSEIVTVAPRFGQINEGIRCDLWPGEIKGLPELDTTGAPTLLVVGNTLDPATPYESAIELDALLDDSVLLTYEGTGHTIVGRDGCIDAFALDYLVNLTPPPPGTTCP